jgi:hypothetical protein
MAFFVPFCVVRGSLPGLKKGEPFTPKSEPFTPKSEAFTSKSEAFTRKREPFTRFFYLRFLPSNANKRFTVIEVFKFQKIQKNFRCVTPKRGN